MVSSRSGANLSATGVPTALLSKLSRDSRRGPRPGRARAKSSSFLQVLRHEAGDAHDERGFFIFGARTPQRRPEHRRNSACSPDPGCSGSPRRLRPDCGRRRRARNTPAMSSLSATFIRCRRFRGRRVHEGGNATMRATCAASGRARPRCGASGVSAPGEPDREHRDVVRGARTLPAAGRPSRRRSRSCRSGGGTGLRRGTPVSRS